ncbi:MAG: ferredoxin [Blastocatellia bacterium]
MDEETRGAYVFKQPSTIEEEQQAREAVEGRPVGAIRDDGEKDSSQAQSTT